MRSRTGINRENRYLRNSGQAQRIPDNKKYAQPKQLISYFDMSFEEFTKKTQCDVSSETVGLKFQMLRRTYHIYVDDELQVVKLKNGIMPKYKASFRGETSQSAKIKAWEYIKAERNFEMRRIYNYDLLKTELLKLEL